MGDYARAEKNAREALPLMEAAGDREGYPLALMKLGDSLRGLGRLKQEESATPAILTGGHGFRAAYAGPL